MTTKSERMATYWRSLSAQEKSAEQKRRALKGWGNKTSGQRSEKARAMSNARWKRYREERNIL